MQRSAAAVGTAVFFALAPGVVAGFVPWWLTGWDLGRPLSEEFILRCLGGTMVVCGAAVLVATFARFVLEGAGTPAPVAPTDRLVVGGLYRFVRNPMYLAVVGTILGQALVLWRPVLLVYAGVVWLCVALFVRAYEEPALSRRFGVQYAAYRRAVRAWWPRLRPWPGEALLVTPPAPSGDSLQKPDKPRDSGM
jgi:protein-S-isoprenylcysteine O-methyltransferase Ste14